MTLFYLHIPECTCASLLQAPVWKSKSFENKVVFDARGREMRTNTTNRTQRKNNLNFPSQNTPTPPRQTLSIRYMPILLVWWAFVCFVVLLFILVPHCLKNPAWKPGCCVIHTGGSASPSALTDSLFLATTQSISEQQTHS